MSNVVTSSIATGRGWMESLPPRWSQCHLRWLAKIFSGGTPDKSKLEYWTDGTVPWVNSGSVNQGLVAEPSAFITELGLSNSSAKWAPKGALVMALAGQGKTKGMVAQMGIDATCNQSMAVIIPNDIDARFLFYWLTSNYRRIRSTASDDLRDGLNLQMLGDIPCPIPPSAEEQQCISNFLDEQTARIDALIAGKEELLGKLAEYRVAIAETVMSDAPGRSRIRLGLHVGLLPGYAFPSEDFSSDPNGIPLLRGINVAPGGIRWDETVYWPHTDDAALERFRLKADDVVFGMDRPWVNAGTRVAMVNENSEGALLLQRVCRLRGGRKFHQRFIYYALASDGFRQSVEVDLTGVSVPHISPEQILGFKVPAISFEEQHDRCEEADRQVSSIDELAAYASQVIDRLREYRSSLISAAVTGQIDINDFQMEAA